jgi:predicted CoA-binding protein
MARPVIINQASSLKHEEPLNYDDGQLRLILKQVKTIAIVGASSNWTRPSNFAMKYLKGKGYRVIPVNPRYVGKKIHNETVYASISNIPENIDMIDIFRPSGQVSAIVDEVLKLHKKKSISVVWMQIGVRDNDSAKRLENYGHTVIMDRCPKIEYGRIFGELSWSGVNSGIISARRTMRGGD